jgi:hypothetical protein
VGVLVGVDVGKAQAAALEESNLCSRFGFDFGSSDTPCKEARQDCGEFGREAACFLVDERGNIARWESGFTVNQNYVAANAERGAC